MEKNTLELKNKSGIPDNLDIFLNKNLTKITRQDFFYVLKSCNSMYDDMLKKKPSGGTRIISAPDDKLKKVQKLALNYLQPVISWPDFIQAYAPGRSTEDTAKNLVDCNVILHTDVKDFFGSITSSNVRTALAKTFGWNPDGDLARSFAKLATRKKRVMIGKHTYEKDRLLESFGDSDYFSIRPFNMRMATGDSVKMAKVYKYIQGTELPQGGCLSALFANLVGYHFIDSKILNYINMLSHDNIAKIKYYRYSDDIYIGIKMNEYSKEKLEEVNDYIKAASLGILNLIASNTNFQLSPKKTYTMTDRQCQRVFSITVNTKANIPRYKYRKMRAILHYTATKGLVEGAKKNGFGSNVIKFFQNISGKLAWFKRINPEKYAKFIPDFVLIADSLKTLKTDELEKLGFDLDYLMKSAEIKDSLEEEITEIELDENTDSKGILNLAIKGTQKKK